MTTISICIHEILIGLWVLFKRRLRSLCIGVKMNYFYRAANGLCVRVKIKIATYIAIGFFGFYWQKREHVKNIQFILLLSFLPPPRGRSENANGSG